VKAARRFFERAIGTTKRTPVEVVTDKAAAYPAMLEELLPGAWHRTDRYANNHIEADHGRLKARQQRVAQRPDGLAAVTQVATVWGPSVADWPGSREGSLVLAGEGTARKWSPW
jgi:transposase-like protein